MKAHHQSTVSSSGKSSATVNTTMEEKDSCYYPGCRKDANCDCDICLASINATLDLMPFSIQKSSLTKLSSSRPNVELTPVSFDSSIISTPIPSSCPKVDSPVLKSTARLYNEKKKKKKSNCGHGVVILRLILGLSLFLSAAIGFSWGSSVLKPRFSADIVSSAGKRSWVVQDLSWSLRILQNELKGFVDDGKVSNCSSLDSVWEIKQDGELLNSRCLLYKSTIEEVSIWGWPLQTAGLLKTGFSSRSFTLLSGRVTEWSNGKIWYSIRKANTTWVHNKWDASVVQLDPDTWILEYKRSSIFDSPTLFQAAAELLKQGMPRVMKRMMDRSLLLSSAFEGKCTTFSGKNRFKIPT